MAKKKANPQSDNTKPPKSHHQTPIDDAASEKLHSLKSLNAMLLKETVERRQQVDSLTHANSLLESELTRCVSDNALLKSELNGLNGLTDQAVRLEIEKGVESRFVAGQAVEMNVKVEQLVRDLNRVVTEKSEIEGEIGEERFILSRVSEERDAIRAQLDERIRVENILRLKMAEAEKMEAAVLEELQKMKVDYDGLVKDKTSIERKMDLVMRERDLIEKRLVKSNGFADELQMNMDRLSEQKKSIEDERDLQGEVIIELQEDVDELNKMVHNLQEGETKLRNEVAELMKERVVSLDTETKMRAEIDILVKVKQDMEVKIERLAEEKSLVAKDLNDALNSLRKQNLETAQLVGEKAKINDAKIRAESDVIKFKEQLEELKNTVTTLGKLSGVQTDEIKKLESEKSRYIAASEQAMKERNNAQASLDGEKQKVKQLTENISKIEKDMEDLQKKLSKMQKETQKLVAEKKDLESTRARLEKEILAVKNSLAKTQKEHDETKGKLRLSQANTSKILKSTSSICNSKEDNNMGIDKETDFGEEIKHHVKEVEAIKKAVKEKESVAEEMKKQLELLNARVAKADKGKSFWTMVSSATTVLAAVSLAYVARGGY